MAYDLVLSGSGDYMSCNGFRYSGTFTSGNTSDRDKRDLIIAAQEMVDAHFLMHGKVAQRCISDMSGENGLACVIRDMEEKAL